MCGVWRRKRQPTPMFLPGESQRWRSLAGCRLWGRTESDRLKQLSSSVSQGFLDSSVGKESACNAGDPVSIPVQGRSAREGIGYHSSILGLPLWLRWQRIHLQCGRPGFDPWVGKIPWRREWQPTPVFLPGESLGQRNLASCSPWGRKDLDTTEQLSTPQHPLCTSQRVGQFQ